jgi:hypothetical protein
MYFDDCERFESMDHSSPLWSSSLFHNPWIMSMSEEKVLAMEKLLGYNSRSAALLTEDQVEEETLRWAIDTNVVWAGEDDDEEEQQQQHDPKSLQAKKRKCVAKYDSIKDLCVASSCYTLLDSLAFVWNIIANALQDQQQQIAQGTATASSSSVHLIVFPKSQQLWDYDVMVNMLLAIQICKPFLPTEVHLQLDLFHPTYKHSPRMWSPELHAPFPTLGISLHEQTKNKKIHSKDEDFDVDAIRAKLDAIFQSTDGHREYITASLHDDHAKILQECMTWIQSKQISHDTNEVEWTIQMEERPFLLYKTLWNTMFTLERRNGLDSEKSSSSAVVVIPFLDSQTLRRVAVTVNAALIRLDIPVRIMQVYTPKKFDNQTQSNNNNNNTTPPPYGMIQITSILNPATTNKF